MFWMLIMFKSAQASKKTNVQSYIDRVDCLDIYIFLNTANILVAIIIRKHCVSIETIIPIFRSQPYGVKIHGMRPSHLCHDYHDLLSNGTYICLIYYCRPIHHILELKQGKLLAPFMFAFRPLSYSIRHMLCSCFPAWINTYPFTPPLWRDLVKILTRKPSMPHLYPWNALISKM